MSNTTYLCIFEDGTPRRLEGPLTQEDLDGSNQGFMDIYMFDEGEFYRNINGGWEKI